MVEHLPSRHKALGSIPSTEERVGETGKGVEGVEGWGGEVEEEKEGKG